MRSRSGYQSRLFDNFDTEYAELSSILSYGRQFIGCTNVWSFSFADYFLGDLPSTRAWFGLLAASFISTAIALSVSFFLIRRREPAFLARNAYVVAIFVDVFGV